MKFGSNESDDSDITEEESNIDIVSDGDGVTNGEEESDSIDNAETESEALNNESESNVEKS